MGNVGQSSKPASSPIPVPTPRPDNLDGARIPVPSPRPESRASDARIPIPTPRPETPDQIVSPLASADDAAAAQSREQRGVQRQMMRALEQPNATRSGLAPYVERSDAGVRVTHIETPDAPNAPSVNLGEQLDRVDSGAGSISRLVARQADTLGGEVRALADHADDGIRKVDSTDLTGAAERLARDGGRILREAPRGSTTGTINNAMRSTHASLSGLTQLLPKGRNYDFQMPFPLVYTDNNGSTMFFPGGSRIQARHGELTLFSNGGYVKAGSIVVTAGQAEMQLGPQENVGRFDRLRVATKEGTFDVQGMVTRLGADGATFARADKVDIDLKNASIRATGVQLDVPNANTATASLESLAVRTSNVTASAGATHYTQTTNPDGSTTIDTATRALDIARGSQHLTADSMSLNLNRSRSGDAGSIRWTGEGVKFVDGTNNFDVAQAAISFTKRADGSTLHMQSQDLALNMAGRQFTSTGNATFDLVYNRDGQLTDATARATSIAFRDSATDLNATGTRLHARFDTDGRLTGLDGGADKFNLALKDGSLLNIDRGTVAISREGDSVLARARAAGGSFTNNSGTYTLGANSALDLRISPETVSLVGSTESFTARNGGNNLAIGNGRVEAVFNRVDGSETVRFSGDDVRYTGVSTSSSLTQLGVKDAKADLVRAADGATSLTMSGTEVGMTVGGHRVELDNAQNVAIATGADGRVSSIDMTLLGRSSVVSSDGKTRISGTNVDAHYNGATQTLRGTFDTAGFTLRDFNGTMRDGNITLSPNALTAAIGAGSFERTTGSTLRGDFTGFNTNVTTDANGLIRTADGAVGTLNARIGSTDVRANSVTLTSRWDGELRDVIANVATGGSIVVASNDSSLRVGAGVYELNNDGNNTWRLGASNFNLQGAYNDVTVKADGQLAGVRIADGNLFIDDVRATRVQVNGSGFSFDGDIKNIHNLAAQVTKSTGEVSGMSLRLSPTGNDSQLTATINGRVSNIPFSLTTDGAGFNASYIHTKNHVAVGFDTAGRGNARVDIKGGLISLESVDGRFSASATVHPSSPARLAYSGLGMVNHMPVGDGDRLRISTSGSIMAGFLGTPDPGHVGVRAGVNVMLPRRVNDQRIEAFDPTAPLVPMPAFGATAHVGATYTTRGGTSHMLGVEAGLIPGSIIETNIQGKMRVAGVPVPNHMNLPATVYAGARYEQETKAGATTTVAAGVFANPTAFAPDNFKLVEPSKYGAMVSVGHRRGNVEFTATGNIANDGKLGGMFGVRVGF